MKQTKNNNSMTTRINPNSRRDKKQSERERLLLLDAAVVSTGATLLLAAGTGKRLMERTALLLKLPEEPAHACLAGAVAGTMLSGGLWVARREVRDALSSWRRLAMFAPFLPF